MYLCVSWISFVECFHLQVPFIVDICDLVALELAISKLKLSGLSENMGKGDKLEGNLNGERTGPEDG